MQLRALEYLLELEKTHSINKAAHAMHISQQGLSHVIDSLEAELGAKLIHRTHRGVTLTAAGKTVAKRAQLILKEHRAMVSELAELREAEESRNGGLTLVMSPYSSITLSDYVYPLMKPYMPVVIHECSNSKIAEMLADEPVSGDAVPVAESDCFYLFDLLAPDWEIFASNPHIVSIPLFSSALGLLCRKDSSLGHRTSIQSEDIRDFPLVFFNGTDYQDAVARASGTWDPKNVVLRVSDPRAISSYVEENKDTGIVLDQLTNAVQRSAYNAASEMFIPFEGASKLVVGFAYLRGSRHAGEYESFANDLLTRCLQSGISKELVFSSNRDQ